MISHRSSKAQSAATCAIKRSCHLRGAVPGAQSDSCQQPVRAGWPCRVARQGAAGIQSAARAGGLDLQGRPPGAQGAAGSQPAARAGGRAGTAGQRLLQAAHPCSRVKDSCRSRSFRISEVPPCRAVSNRKQRAGSHGTKQGVSNRKQQGSAAARSCLDGGWTDSCCQIGGRCGSCLGGGHVRAHAAHKRRRPAETREWAASEARHGAHPTFSMSSAPAVRPTVLPLRSKRL
jgi:hypothetical protein